MEVCDDQRRQSRCAAVKLEHADKQRKCHVHLPYPRPEAAGMYTAGLLLVSVASDPAKISRHVEMLRLKMHSTIMQISNVMILTNQQQE
jgi:hypothetical protein